MSSLFQVTSQHLRDQDLSFDSRSEFSALTPGLSFQPVLSGFTGMSNL